MCVWRCRTIRRQLQTIVTYRSTCGEWVNIILSSTRSIQTINHRNWLKWCCGHLIRCFQIAPLARNIISAKSVEHWNHYNWMYLTNRFQLNVSKARVFVCVCLAWRMAGEPINASNTCDKSSQVNQYHLHQWNPTFLLKVDFIFHWWQHIGSMPNAINKSICQPW